MPISREEFESGRIDHAQDVLRILIYRRDLAYSQAELLSLINYQGPTQGARGPIEFIQAMTGRPVTTPDELEDTLLLLVAARLVRSKEIDGAAYFVAG